MQERTSAATRDADPPRARIRNGTGGRFFDRRRAKWVHYRLLSCICQAKKQKRPRRSEYQGSCSTPAKSPGVQPFNAPLRSPWSQSAGYNWPAGYVPSAHSRAWIPAVLSLDYPPMTRIRPVPPRLIATLTAETGYTDSTPLPVSYMPDQERDFLAVVCFPSARVRLHWAIWNCSGHVISPRCRSCSHSTTALILLQRPKARACNPCYHTQETGGGREAVPR